MHLDLDGDVGGALKDLVVAVVAAPAQQGAAPPATDRRVHGGDLLTERQPSIGSGRVPLGSPSLGARFRLGGAGRQTAVYWIDD
jgi:hypothetical protein